MTGPAPLQTSAITAVLLPDGQWHQVAAGDEPFIFENPQFADPFGGPPKSIPGLWLWWAEDPGGGAAPIPHGTPVGQILDTHWTPPQQPAPARPAVTGISPAAGPAGTTVAVTGSGFTGATGVRFGSQAAAFTAESDTALSATSPAVPAGQVADVTVTGPGGTSPAVPADQYTGQ